MVHSDDILRELWRLFKEEDEEDEDDLTEDPFVDMYRVHTRNRSIVLF